MYNQELMVGLVRLEHRYSPCPHHCYITLLATPILAPADRGWKKNTFRVYLI